MPRAPADLQVQELRAHLKRVLPDYMQPSAYVVLEAFPLTATGKLDRQALPSPSLDAYASRDYEAPQGEIEQALAALWQSVLRADRVGRDDNFFELGGHSLSGMQVLTRIHAAFGVEVPMRMLFDSPTLRQLASCVEGLRVASPLVRVDDEDAQTRELLARVAAMPEHEVRQLLREFTMEGRP